MHDGIVRNKWPIRIQRDVWDSLAVLEGFRTGSWVVVEGLLDFHGSSEDSCRFSDLNGGGGRGGRWGLGTLSELQGGSEGEKKESEGSIDVDVYLEASETWSTR